ncbi:hypothetical protein GGI35DRAFT_430717 [Trichoderma velutinum]
MVRSNFFHAFFVQAVSSLGHVGRMQPWLVACMMAFFWVAFFCSFVLACDSGHLGCDSGQDSPDCDAGVTEHPRW